MEDNRSFDKATKMDTELMADGGKIYSFTFKDGHVESVYVSGKRIKDFIKNCYEMARSMGETFDQDHYEEEREKIIIGNDTIHTTETDIIK